MREPMTDLISRHRRARWSALSAFIGGIIWIADLAVAGHSYFGLGTIERLLLLAPLVIIPLGFLLADTPNGYRRGQSIYRMACLIQPFAAFLVVVSFWLTPGVLAASLTLPWLLVSGLAGLSRLHDLLRRGFGRVEDVCFDAGLLYLVVGAAWLVLSRFGGSQFGFEEPIVLLTAVHFHYTGFAVPLIMGAVGRALNRAFPRAYTLFRFVAIGVIGGPPLIAVGFVFSPLLKVVAVIWLAVSLVGLSVFSVVVLPTIRHRVAQGLLAISTISVLVGMALAAVYAVGEFTGQLWLSIPHMARTHGVINALGFTLCGLLAWIIED